MVKPAIPADEKERLTALHTYGVLDTLPEKDYDEITRLASELCETPISTISLIDDSVQFLKSFTGMERSVVPRHLTFCGHAINQPGELMVVPDSLKDIRFMGNPLTETDHPIIFYAGFPLTNPDGYTLGTLCVMDSKPRQITATQQEALKTLANVVVKLLELRKKNGLLEESEARLRNVNQELENFAYVVSHDLKSPVNNIVAFIGLLKEEYGKKLDDHGNEMLGYLAMSGRKLKGLIEGILAYSKGDNVLFEKMEDVNVQPLLEGVISLLDPHKKVQFRFSKDALSMNVNKIALEQIFINLIGNAIKYNDKEQPIIDIGFSSAGDHYKFFVKDNGAGIAETDFNRIFNIFETLGKKDRDQHYGTGIGLATVRKLVERLGGTIEVASEIKKGTTFSFTIKKNNTSNATLNLPVSE